MASKKELEEKYLQIQIIDQELKKIDTHVQAIDEQLVEIESIKASIEEFRSVAAGQRLLFPLSQGIFAKAALVEPRKLYINVGAGIVVDKTPEEASKLLTTQQDSLSKNREILLQQMEKLITLAKSFEKELSASKA